jgi:hypothetical protein
MRLDRRQLGLAGLAMALPATARAQGELRLWPPNGAADVNPDTPLIVALAHQPQVGASGLIRIYDAADNRLVDTLDMSIPPGPDWRRRRPAGSPPDTTVYQEKTVGGVEGLHFYPVIVHGRLARIYPHRTLEYGKRYEVRIDPGVLSGFAGFGGGEWAFTTKRAPPAKSATRLVVAADGSGDFSTVQGAVDFVPDKPDRPVTIFVRNGDYEEMVYARNKSNLIIRGESQDGVVVGCGNNSAFNPAKPRYAFSLQNCTDCQLSTFTINNYFYGQAEALMLRGERLVVDRMTLNGSGDALQMTTGSTAYFTGTKLFGHGDTILTSAAAFFDRCQIRSLGPFIWPRNPATNRGVVFKDSTFVAVHEPAPWTLTPEGGGTVSKSVLARIPDNNGINYPHAEVVLINCRMEGIAPDAWTVQPPPWDSSNVHFWEFGSRDLNGRPIDVSMRHPVSRQLSAPKDAKLISDYSRPEFVLGGWKPIVRRL